MAKVDEILPKVLTLTKLGKLQWELVGRDSFRAQVGKLFLTTSQDRNDDGDSVYIFSIYDDDGNLLEDTIDIWHSEQRELYEQARRSALKVDEALESLDEQLKKLI